MNQIRKKDAVNTALFVLRCFGGIKLGKRGLIDAYGRAVVDVIKSVAFINWMPMVTLEIEAELKYYGDIIQVISKFESKILNNYSDENLKLKINISAEKRSESLIGGAFGNVKIKGNKREPNQGG